MSEAQELANLLEDAISVLKTAVADDIENIRAVAEVKHELYKSYIDRQESLKNILRSTFWNIPALKLNPGAPHGRDLIPFSVSCFPL